MVSCSGIQVPCFRHFTWLICRPRDLWTEAQSEQMRIPLLTEAQLGSPAPQSAQTDRGWRDLDLLLLLNIFRAGEERGGEIGQEQEQEEEEVEVEGDQNSIRPGTACYWTNLGMITVNVSSDAFLSVFSFPLRVFSPSFDWGWSGLCAQF